MPRTSTTPKAVSTKPAVVTDKPKDIAPVVEPPVQAPESVIEPAPVDPEVIVTAGAGVVKPVSSEKAPEVVAEQKVAVFIDPEMTDGGLSVNGKLYVGRMQVPESMVDDLLRMQEEYFETKKKLIDPQVSVRMKNDYQKEALFLADPKVNENKKGFTRDYGLLGAKEWGYCHPTFKAYLLEQRMQRYGY